MATTLESFLVSLSAKVDRESFNKLKSNLSDVKTSVKQVAVGFGALTAGVVALADHFSRLGYEARNVGSTVSGMGRLSYAMKQMGATGDGVKTALNNLYDFLHYKGPGAEQFIRRLGISTRDAQGHLRDTADVLTDLFVKLKAINSQGIQGQAKAFKIAELLGIPENLYKRGIDNPLMIKQYENQYDNMYKAFGLDPNKAAAESQKLMVDMRRLTLAIEIMGQKIAMSLIHSFGGKDLNSFTNYLIGHSDQLAQAVDNMVKVITVAASGIVSIGKGIDKAVSATVGWKVALEAALGVFALHKILPVLGAMAAFTRLAGSLGAVGAKGAAGVAGATVRGLASPLGKVAVGAGLAGVADMLGLGGVGELAGAALPFLFSPIGAAVLGVGAVGLGGYELYKHKKDLENWWHNSHFFSQAHASENPQLNNVLVNKRAQQAMSFFMSKGFSQAAAAGIVGNLWQESQLGLNMGDNKNAIGIAQWSPERATQIQEEFGLNVWNSDFMTQLQAVYDEMKEGDDNDARKAYLALQTTSDPTVAASIVRRLYERPKNANGNEDYLRGSKALSAYNGYSATYSMTNNITVNAQGGNAKEIANAVSQRIGEQWNAWQTNVSPRQVGMLGHS